MMYNIINGKLNNGRSIYYGIPSATVVDGETMAVADAALRHQLGDLSMVAAPLRLGVTLESLCPPWDRWV